MSVKEIFEFYREHYVYFNDQNLKANPDN